MQTTPMVYNIFKPVGRSSQQIVSYFKYHLPIKPFKIGHFGTLDPFASGVLLIGVNGAMRANEFIHQTYPKTYRAIGKLGVKTQTGDILGKVIKTSCTSLLNSLLEQGQGPLQKKLEGQFLGEYWQRPPIFSASKYQGKALHQWARQGVQIIKEAKKRYIYSLSLEEVSLPYFSFSVTVSSGTYIRKLFEEMAEFMGFDGTLVSLQRTAIGPFLSQNSLMPKDWPQKGQSWDERKKGTTIWNALPLEKVHLDQKGLKSYISGLDQENLSYQDGERYWVFGASNKALGLGEYVDKKLKVVFNFPQN